MYLYYHALISLNLPTSLAENLLPNDLFKECGTNSRRKIVNRKIKITTIWLFNVFNMVQWFMIYDDFPVRYIKQLEGSFRVFHEHKFLQPQPVRMFCSLFTPLSASSRRVHHYSVLPRRIWRHYLQAKFGQPWSPTVKNMEENNYDFKVKNHLFHILFTSAGYLEVSGGRSLDQGGHPVWTSGKGPTFEASMESRPRH
jgi:hypothetical protein